MDERSRIRGAVIRLFQHRAGASLVGFLERTTAQAADYLPVLTYHRVAPRSADHLDPGLISATPEELDDHLRHLGARFTFLTLSELLAVRSGTTRLRRRSILLTFDDAYGDFLEHAWPVLERHGVPATLFVPTGYPDDPTSVFPWERLYHSIMRSERSALVDALPPRDAGTDRLTKYRVVSRLIAELPWEASLAAIDRLSSDLEPPPQENPVLGWQELIRLAGGGLDLAAHTHGHVRLDRAPVSVIDREIRRSLDELTRRIGRVLPVLAYPAGHHDALVVERARAAGIEVAFTTRRGLNDVRRCDWMRMRRINVGPRSSLALIRAQLIPGFARLTGA
jgi:peptidoglycan/xylan/chitin deacetylase (PgdA/CDA1 family)